MERERSVQPHHSVASAITFRVPTDGDFAVLAEIRRDARMQAMLMAIPDRTDDAAISAWIARRMEEPNGMFRVIAAGAPGETAGEAVGFMQIHSVHRRNGCAYGALAILDRCTVPGVALLAMRELVRFARQDLGLFKLMAEIRADNALAIRMNTLMGYSVIGTLKSHFCDHARNRHDVVLLEKLL